MTRGYGKIAEIDLSSGGVEVKEPDERLAYDFIGGRGWAAYIVFKHLNEIVHGTHPSNVLVVATGPLAATGFLGGCKTTFAAISPQTDIYGDSSVGGYFGYMVRKAGFDALIIRGRASELSYLLIENGKIEAIAAPELRKLNSKEVDEKLRGKYGRNCSIASIGLAGENLVNYASINVDWGLKERRQAQAGRTGMGAVMGSKNLKALVARGSGEVDVADPERLREVNKRLIREVKSSRMYENWMKYGTNMTVEWANSVEALPTLNFQKTIFEHADEISGRAVHSSQLYVSACANCIIPCGHVVGFDGGEATMDYENLGMLGSNLGLGNLKEVAKAIYLCDYYGLDTISTGAVIAFVAECFQRGLLTKDDVGFEVTWGDAEKVYELIGMIAERRGFGTLMALGVRALAKYVKMGSEKFAMHVKGLEISAYDHRAAPAMALSYATCDIGAHHNRSWAITYDVEAGRTSYQRDKAERVIYLQHMRPLFDMLGVCRLYWVELGIDPNIYAEAYSAVVGREFTLDELLTASERVWNLTRVMAMLRRGVSVKDDALPDRNFEDPVPEGSTKGILLDRGQFMELLKTYYRLRGWDESGRPTREKLISLKLEDVAEKLYG
ncbi:MAG: aldehyde ferredoxin oxidoreductase family protein [Aigarchaeota archaeon]|nr:aldehyde ferredoxin oxidoreductase family protein [Aigarchaeota archaeon]MDW8021555.1 aldehyde ferredoxin oxidoreductase family protein [Nitrososphaerota archaeon]